MSETKSCISSHMEITIARELREVKWQVEHIPPMSPAAAHLLTLDSDARSDPRILALIAQREPVMLARLLGMANSALYTPASGKPVTNLDSAIRLIGADAVYSAMLAIAMGDAFQLPPSMDEVKRFLLRHTFSLWQTSRNLCRYLRAEEPLSGLLQLATLFEVLGVYVAALPASPISDKVVQRIQQVTADNCAPSCEQGRILDYQSISAQVAQAWSAPAEVVEALGSEQNELGRLLGATEALICARLNGSEQAEVLVEKLGGTKWLKGLVLPEALDLVALS